MGVITFNGLSSKDFGIEVELFPTYQTPRKIYDVIHIPGRNGDLHIDTGAYENVNRTYEIAIGSYDGDYTEMANKVSEWLHSASGYSRLEDSYEPGYYRLAVYEEEMELSNIYNHGGRTYINFNCKPQRFLKLGDRPIKFTAAGNLRNPTRFESLPIITIKGTGSGVLRVDDYTITISSIDSYLTIDSELQDAYKGAVNKNSSISSLSNGFPILKPGLTEISYSGGITEVEVIPKWWTL